MQFLGNQYLVLYQFFKQDLERLDFSIMIKNFKKNPENLINYYSDLLLKILNKYSIETKNSEDNELFVDENWKINKKRYW